MNAHKSDLATRVYRELRLDIQSEDPAITRRVANLRKDFLRKLRDNKPDANRTKASIDKWLAAEVRCFSFNRIIGDASDFSTLGKLLLRMQAHIESVIGANPPRGLFRELSRFTPGASYGTRRGTHYSVKMKGLAVTPSVALHLDSFKGITNDLEIVRGCRLCAVPKTRDVDRLIAIEPSGNAFLQQAVGRYFKKRLLSYASIDLFDQTRNQRGAARAIQHELATIDLESASDTVCYELVRRVLPPAWFSLLDELRSPTVKMLDGKVRYLDKFSSMGNGYTFELETLIFWSLCKSVCQRTEADDLLVYGDDIIIHQYDAPTVIKALKAVGFLPNVEKSFTSGDYFESCGKHYYRGDEVTSVFQKEPVTDVSSAMRCHNRLVRWAVKYDLYSVVRKACRLLRKTFGFPNCLIPIGVERDDGWLVDPSFISKDAHGDFITYVIKYRPVRNNRFDEDNCYRYKLFDPSHTNELPDGRCSNVIGNRLLPAPRRARIWSSSLTG